MDKGPAPRRPALPLLFIDLEGPRLTADERAVLRSEPIAGLCLFARNTPDHASARDLVAEARSLAPGRLVVTVDQEGGGVARLLDGVVPPAAMALGAADDLALTEAVAAATGRSLRSVGIDVDLAPVADVASELRNPVIADRAFGDDPAAVGRQVAAFVRGLQGAGVAATLKHFPGHGDVTVDSHLDLPRLDASRERLEAVEWPPFRAGIAAGAAAVMTAHLLVPALDPELPATLSAPTLALLRSELGFGGVIFSDAMNMRAVTDRWPIPQATVMALAAGVDAPMLVGALDEHLDALRAVEAALAEGRLDPAAMRASAARIARLADAFPPLGRPSAAVLAGDVALMAKAARRAVVALGRPPRLRQGDRVAVVGAASVAASAATDLRAKPTGALINALEAAGIEALWRQPDELQAADLAGRQALLVVSSQRTPLTAADLQEARRAFALAEAAGLSAVHVALWNPAHAADLPAPALLSFGFRPQAVEAAVHALLTGEVPGRLPIALETAP